MKDNKSAGFSLIGLALLMIILGVVISTPMFYIFNQESMDQKKTLSILKANKNALLGFVATRGRLPDAVEYLTLVPSRIDGYLNNTVYLYDSQLITVNVLCASTTSMVFDKAFIILSLGRNGIANSGHPATSGVLASVITDDPYSDAGTPNNYADDTDDLLVSSTLAELQAAHHCFE